MRAKSQLFAPRLEPGSSYSPTSRYIRNDECLHKKVPRLPKILQTTWNCSYTPPRGPVYNLPWVLPGRSWRIGPVSSRLSIQGRLGNVHQLNVV